LNAVRLLVDVDVGAIKTFVLAQTSVLIPAEQGTAVRNVVLVVTIVITRWPGRLAGPRALDVAKQAVDAVVRAMRLAAYAVDQDALGVQDVETPGAIIAAETLQ